MTLEEMMEIVLRLIEEYDKGKESMTSDPDIEAKIKPAINQVQFELARLKKIPAVKVLEVKKNQSVDLNTVDSFYQLRLLRFEKLN